MGAQTAFCELPTAWACYFCVSSRRQVWVSALAWREDEKGLCTHGSCGSARCPVVPGEMWAGEDSVCPFLHWSMFWSVRGAATCCMALLGDCCVSSRQDWSTVFILQPLLVSQLLFPTAAHHRITWNTAFSPAVCWWKGWKECAVRSS